jgi:hypothetical protein
VWYLSDCLDLEFGYSWNGSYVRVDLKSREHNVLFYYDVPIDRVGSFMKKGMSLTSNKRIKLMDLWRVHKRRKPEGMTCIKWVSTLLDFPELSSGYPITMRELATALYTIGAIRHG